MRNLRRPINIHFRTDQKGRKLIDKRMKALKMNQTAYLNMAVEKEAKESIK